ncbi:hypothetical protein AR688_02605 [Rheinheimera sp. EpRS3]|nr:hypothetical protein AR688_02605 [Rheinheimera sp. EpRS3]
MTKSEFIKRAKKISFDQIVRNGQPVSQVLLTEVLSTDHCFLVQSGEKHQFWITRNNKLCLVSSTLKSSFCVVA